MTQVNGILLFILPFYNWLNHGFFNFNPILFSDLSKANDYEIIKLSFATSEGLEIAAEIDGVQKGSIKLPTQPQERPLSISEIQSRGAIKPITFRLILWRIAKTLGGTPPERELSRVPAAVRSLASRSANINVVAALRKRKNAPFKTPLQSMYASSNIGNSELWQRYNVD